MVVYLDGEKVKAMREDRWMSREEFAAEAGIGVSTLRNIESYGKGVRLNTARKVAAALGANPKSLRRARGRADQRISAVVG